MFKYAFNKSELTNEANKISENPQLKDNIKDVKELIEIITYAYYNKGLAEGEYIRKWIEKKLKSETDEDNLTFAELSQLHEKDPKKYKLLTWLAQT